MLICAQTGIFVLVWAFLTPDVIPKPWEVLSSLKELLADGFLESILTSLWLYIEAMVIASILSLGLVYLGRLPAFQSLGKGWSKLRFLGIVGLPFLLAMYISDVHWLKLALLVFAASVFLVTGMLDVVNEIPQEEYDLARTLRMSEWGVLWQVIVLGQRGEMFDVIRQNAAIGWMMLPMIEGIYKNEGGIGAVLDIQNKNFHLSTIGAIQLIVIGIGLIQDYGIGIIKNICCPYANLGLEKK